MLPFSHKISSSSVHATSSRKRNITTTAKTVTPDPSWRQSRRALLDRAAQELQFTDLSSWYQISLDKLPKNAQTMIVNNYASSIPTAVVDLIPENHFLPWRFKHTPKTFWHSIANQRLYLDWLKGELNITKLEDWYKIDIGDLQRRDREVNLITEKHNGSFIKALMACYPEDGILPWKFSRVPTNFWLERANIKNFFDWLKTELNVDSAVDISARSMIKYGGRGILEHHTFKQALKIAYPELQFNSDPSTQMPPGYWLDIRTQRAFMDKLGLALGIQSPADWYGVSQKDVKTHGGSGLLKRYGGSIIRALRVIYPEKDWSSSKFYQPHQKFRTVGLLSPLSTDSFLSSLSSIGTKAEELYLICNEFAKLPKASLLEQLIGYRHKRQRLSKRQLAVYKSLLCLFPDRRIYVNYKHPVIGDRQQMMQFDFYLPELKLAFEYQGEQHYEFLPLYGSHKELSKRDQDKRDACAKQGIALTEIPFWWDGMTDSIQATIHSCRPGVVSSGGLPIPAMQPPNGHKAIQYIPVRTLFFMNA